MRYDKLGSILPILTQAGTNLNSFDYLYDAEQENYQQIVNPTYILTIDAQSYKGGIREGVRRGERICKSFGFFVLYDVLFEKAFTVIANDIVVKLGLECLAVAGVEDWLFDVTRAKLWEIGDEEDDNVFTHYRDSSFVASVCNNVGMSLEKLYKLKLRSYKETI